MSKDNVIEVRSLVKMYGDLAAVDDVTFDVKSKEVFSFLGPNGAGKTTTVEILESLRDPSGGDAFVLGYDVRKKSDQEEIRKRIGVVPQDFSAFDWLTIRENVDYFKGLYGSNTDTKYLLKLVGLDEKANSYYRTLSGGMKQRLGIAIALVNDPEVIFLDEPTAGLDPKGRRDTWNLIRQLRDEGKTTFLTTHYMEEAQALSDTVVIIISGKIVARGSAEELIDKYGGRKSIAIRNSGEDLLSHLGGMDAKRGQNGEILVRFETHDDLSLVLSILDKNRENMAEIEIRRPNLEDVFLNVTGKRITSEGSVD